VFPGVTVTEAYDIALGWSVKKSFLGIARHDVAFPIPITRLREVAVLQHDVQAAEAKLAEMNRASARRWQTFEHDVNAAMARLHKALDTPAS
jgi:hypothetical protein